MSHPADKAFGAIDADLRQKLGHKRRFFAPALAMSAAVCVAAIAFFGVRPDLGGLPAAQVGLLATGWVLALAVLPAVGLGLWFPKPATRIALLGATGAAVMFGNAAPALTNDSTLTGWFVALGHDGCTMVVAAAGALLIGIGSFSGAFCAQRRGAAVFWIAAGVALAGLELVGSVCPSSAAGHLVGSHLVPSSAVLAIAVLAGFVQQRRAHAIACDEPDAANAS